MKKGNMYKKVILLLTTLVIIIGMVGCGSKDNKTNNNDKKTTTENKQNENEKNLKIKIIYKDSSDKDVTKEYDIKTTDDTLDKVIINEKLGEGKEDTYGLFITTMDGRTADDSKQEWWCINKDGKELMTGASDTKVSDGDEFEFALKTGY